MFKLFYDFDVWDVSDTAQKANSSLIDFRSRSYEQLIAGQLARFRHEETAEAAARAPAPIRLFLEQAGFCYVCSPNHVPNGFYCQADEQLRRKQIGQMSELLSNKALRKAINRSRQESTFDFNAFMAYVVTAKPTKLTPDGTAFRIEPRRPHQLREAQSSRVG